MHECLTGSGKRREGPSWFVAQCGSSRERLAEQHLGRQGFRTFLPAVRRPRKSADKKAWANEALFPGYIFVSFDKDRDRWRSINGTIGVSRLVTFGDEPVSLPGGFVESLMRSIAERGEIAEEDDLRSGDQIRVVGSVFDDLTGTLVTANRRERVTVLLNLLSGPRKVSLPRVNLMKV